MKRLALALLCSSCAVAVAETEHRPMQRVETETLDDAGTKPAREAMGVVELSGRGCRVSSTTVQCEKAWLATIECESGDVWVFDGESWKREE